MNKEKRRKPRRGMSMELRRQQQGWWYILPWLFGTFFFFCLPMIEAFTYSINQIIITPNGFSKKYIGVDNYLYFLTVDDKFLRNLADSVLGMVPQVILIVSLSVFLAVLIKDKFAGRTLVRSVFFFPVILASGVVLTVLQQDAAMNGTNTAGSGLTYLFKVPSLVSAFAALGVPDAFLAFITSVVNKVFDLTWKSGVQILLMQAAINNVPMSSYEVADIEGATAWEKFWMITFPMISPSFVVVIIYTVIDSFTDYGNKVMTMLRTYYSQGNYSYSATIGVIYFIAVLLLIGVINLLLKKTVYYEQD